MENNIPKDSTQGGQINEEQKSAMKDETVNNVPEDNQKDTSTDKEVISDTNEESTVKGASEEQSEDNVKKEIKAEEESGKEAVSDTNTDSTAKESPEEQPEDSLSEKVISEKEAPDTNKDSATNESSEEQSEDSVKVEAKTEESDKKETSETREKPDYETLSQKELLEELKYLLENSSDIIDNKNGIEEVKTIFFKNNRLEYEEKKKNFLEEGGDIIDFKPDPDPIETEFKELLENYKDLKSEANQKLEEEKTRNLEEKYKIIEELKELVNKEESLNKTFKEFHTLQTRWREIGLVPQQQVKNLWETYHHHVEKFYDYIKINKELRDLDLKKNLEEKIKLCERAEELVIESNVVQSFKELQVLHDQWREIGPVPRENREEIWLRFKDSTAKINKKHQEFFVNLKEEQKHNLEKKEALCEKAEEIANSEINSFKEWDTQTTAVVELQKVWKTIGFAPKKDNVKIYDRFRQACDAFFKKKREFYAHIREEQSNNLQLKTDLCVQAEALKDSTDWKKTTDELIKLQKHWKEIGPVPKKYSEPLWKRFRTACDTFFNNKSSFFSNVDEKYEENLKKKEELIKHIELFSFGGTPEENFNSLKELQRQWTEIGFVPLSKKDEIQSKYREAINAKFDKLKIDDDEKASAKFNSKLEDLSTKPNGIYRMSQDRDKMIIKIKQLENDVTLWENNKGFFSNSKNAQALIADVEKKIEAAREKIIQLEQKIAHINNFLDNH